MFIYKSDFVECNRNTLLNIHKVMTFGETAQIVSLVGESLPEV